MSKYSEARDAVKEIIEAAGVDPSSVLVDGMSPFGYRKCLSATGPNRSSWTWQEWPKGIDRDALSEAIDRFLEAKKDGEDNHADHLWQVQDAAYSLVDVLHGRTDLGAEAEGALKRLSDLFGYEENR